MVRLKKWGIGLLVVFLAAYLGLSYFFSNLLLFPPRRSFEDINGIEHRTKENFPAFLQDSMPLPASFTVKSTYDGVALKGWLFDQDSSQCAAVVLHGWGSNRLSMLKYARIFMDCGCTVALFDHRAHGESGGDMGSGGQLEAKDLLDVTAWLSQKTDLPYSHIGWLGSSWGAATALQAGAAPEKMAFIIAESPFQDWETAIFERANRQFGTWIGLFRPGVLAVASLRLGANIWNSSVLKASDDINEPVLLIHSKADTQTDASQSVNIAEQMGAERCEFHNLDWGAWHSNNIYERPEEYRSIIEDFLKRRAPGWGGDF